MAVWTMKELKEVARRTGATFAGQPLEQPAAKKVRVRRKKKQPVTEAEKAIAEEKRLHLHRKFETAWAQLGGPPLVAERMVVEGRRYRTDYIHKLARVSIEINGGTWSKKKTGHNSGSGIERDATKQNLVVMNGYVPFILTSKMLAKKNIVSNLMPIIEFIKERIARAAKARAK